MRFAVSCTDYAYWHVYFNAFFAHRPAEAPDLPVGRGLKDTPTGAAARLLSYLNAGQRLARHARRTPVSRSTSSWALLA